MTEGNPSSPSDHLFQVSDELISRMDFSGCQELATRMQSSAALAAAQVLAVTGVLRNRNPSPNYYSVLQLETFCADAQQIRKQFKKLDLLLNPATNKSSFVKEALSLVREAWAVLQDPKRKDLHDSELRKINPGGREKEESRIDGYRSFWTACPYCYHVYEYDEIYEDCCLKCQNCRRVFHGIRVPEPPPEALGKDGYYACYAFIPIGYNWRAEAELEGRYDANCGNAGGIASDFVEIRDDIVALGGGSVKRNKRPVENLHEEAKCAEQSGDVMQSNEEAKKKRPMMRRKTMAWNTNKMRGTGRRGRGRRGCEPVVAEAEEVENMDLDKEEEVESYLGGAGSSGGMGRQIGQRFVFNGVECFAGDDDIMVSLPVEDDQGN